MSKRQKNKPKETESLIESGTEEQLTELNKNLDLYLLQQAREHLGIFGYLVFGWDYRYKHIQVFVEKLHQIATGKINRLMILAPPRHAKTNWAVIAFSAWMLGRRRDLRILHVSNTSNQAHLNSIAVRDTITMNPKYTEVFPGTIPDKHKPQAESGWFTSIDEAGRKDPSFAAYGAQGGIYGRGCDLLILDDLNDEANTSTKYQRDKLFDWLSAKVESRVENGARVFTQHRFHNEDIAGKILNKEGRIEEGGLWTVVTMKAIDDDGNALWPEYQPLYKLEQDKRRNILIWESLYQQNPSALSGDIIKADWLQPLPKTFSIRRLVIGVDLAISQKESADFTALVLIGVDQYNRLGLLWLERGRWSFREQVQKIENLYRIGNSLGSENGVVVESIAVETNQYQLAMAQVLRSSSFLPITEVKSIKDKVSRASGWISRAECGDFFFDQNLQLWPDFLVEAVSFGKRVEHDDMLDAISAAWQALDNSGAPVCFVI